MARRGIVAKLAFTSTAVMLALGLVVAWYSLYQLRMMVSEEAYRRVVAQSLSWIDANQGPITYASPEVLARVLREFTERERLAYTVFENASGNVVAQSKVPDDLKPDGVQPVAVMGNAQVYRMTSGANGRYIEVKTGVPAAGSGMSRDLGSMFAMAAGAQSAGTLRVGIDNREIENRLRAAALRNAPLYAVFILIATCIQVIMARRFVTPVAEIAKAARSIACHDLSARVNQGYDRTDEVGELVRNFNDMTSRLEQNRNEMQAFQTGLEEKVRERTAELETLNARLRELDQRKSDFLSTASHEVRTPLTSIKAFAEILLDSNIADEQTRRRFLNIINAESDRLSRLISDLLDLAKIESGVLDWKFTEVDVRQVVHEAVATVVPSSHEKALAIHVEAAEPCLVRADADRARQVLNNLLSNAVKFSTAGGTIRLAVEQTSVKRGGAPGDPHYVCISVTDNGPGIDVADRERVFERFYRGPEAARGTKGTGLGLAICREIVLRHGGEIWVESEVGRGSTFLFTLPLAAATDNAGVSTMTAG